MIHIISGGPGSGKTSLCEALKQKGYSVHDEIARKVIRKEITGGTTATPWQDLPLFSEKVFQEMMNEHLHSNLNKIAFTDRGLPDIIAYLNESLCQIPIKYIRNSKQLPYSKKVFLTPPWEDIYVNDTERLESFQHSIRLFESLRKNYLLLGFIPVLIPKITIENRVSWLINDIKGT